MEPLRVASIGLGWWGAELAGRADAADIDVVSCYARTPSSRDEFAATYGCRAAASFDEQLADPDVEAILIATPHSTHSDMVVQAAAAGKHVFCDKPFTLDVASAKRAVAAAEAAGIVLQVGHNRRRQPANRRLKHMIDNDELGMIHYAEANMSYPKGLDPRGGWRGDPAESPAGGMTGLGVHLIDNLVYLLGPAVRVSAFSRRVIGVSELDDVTTAIIEFERGALASLGTSMVIPFIGRTAVWGTKGSAANEVDGSKFYVQQIDDRERTLQPVETIDTVADELAEFARNVRTGALPETGGREALEVVAVFEAIVESASTGRTVDVAEIRSRG